MPLPYLSHGRQCRAKAKSTGKQCQNLAVRGWSVCRNHGYHRKIVKGKDCHFYRHGQETRAERIERPKINAKLNTLGALLMSGKPITRLPESLGPEAKKLNAEMDELLKRGNISSPEQPKTLIEQARAARLKPKKKQTLTPEQRQRKLAYMRLYNAKKWQETKAAKQQAELKAVEAKAAYLKELKKKH